MVRRLVLRRIQLVTEIDAHRQCLSARLLSLRADFGRDLGRLSGSDRRRIDAACARLRPPRIGPVNRDQKSNASPKRNVWKDSCRSMLALLDCETHEAHEVVTGTVLI